MNRILKACVLAALSVSLFVSCENPSDDPKTGDPKTPEKIGMLLPTSAQLRFLNDSASFTSAITASGNTPVVRYVSSTSGITAEAEAAAIDSIVATGVKVLVFLVSNRTDQAVLTALTRAKDAGVKIVSYDRLLDGNTPSYYVSFDNVEVGRVQGAYLVGKVTGTTKPL